jgi:hypothetical protein
MRAQPHARRPRQKWTNFRKHRLVGRHTAARSLHAMTNGTWGRQIG